MSVLVTGGCGAVGSFVTRLLHERGEEVVVFDSGADTRLLADILPAIDLVRGDILHLPQLLETFQQRRVRRVIHTAALMPDPVKRQPYVGTLVNVVGLTNVLEAARLSGVERVVFASTRGVYAEPSGPHTHPTYQPITEDYPKNPHSLYDASRFYGERLGLQYLETYGLDFCATRFGHTFGPGKLTHGNLTIPCRIVEGAYQGEAVRIPKGGDQADDLVYNRDAAYGLVCAAFAANPTRRIYQIGTGRASTLRDVERAVRRHFPDADVEIGPGLDYKGHRNSYCIYDISRAKSEIGYEPQFSMEEAVDDYLALLDRLDYFGVAPRLRTAVA